MRGLSETSVRHLLTRRGLLRLGLVLGGGALVLSGAGASWLFSTRAPGPGRTALSEPEARTLAAIADAYFPPGGPFGVAARSMDIAAAADAYIAGFLPRERNLLRGVLTLWEQWPRAQGLAPFAALPFADRVAVLRAFETSSIQPRVQLAALLRAIVGLVFLEQPAALVAMGHRPGCAVGLVP